MRRDSVGGGEIAGESRDRCWQAAPRRLDGVPDGRTISTPGSVQDVTQVVQVLFREVYVSSHLVWIVSLFTDQIVEIVESFKVVGGPASIVIGEVETI